MLPPDQRVHGVAPGRALDTAAVTTIVVGVRHLGKHVRRLVVLVGLLSVPGLAQQAALGRVHLALVISPIALDTGGCKKIIDVEVKIKTVVRD